MSYKLKLSILANTLFSALVLFLVIDDKHPVNVCSALLFATTAWGFFNFLCLPNTVQIE